MDIIKEMEADPRLYKSPLETDWNGWRQKSLRELVKKEPERKLPPITEQERLNMTEKQTQDENENYRE